VVVEMENISKRKRITIAASVEGVERAEKSMLRLGIGSKETLAESIEMGKSTVNKFFQRQPIQLDSFKRICDGLKMKDWRTVAELENVVEQTEAGSDAKSQLSASILNPITTDGRAITVTDRKTGEVKIEIILEGNINANDDNFQITLTTLLKNYGGETIRITDIKPGSIKVTVEGSQKDIEKLLSRINSGEIAELDGFPIQKVQVLSLEYLTDIDSQDINRANLNWAFNVAYFNEPSIEIDRLLLGESSFSRFDLHRNRYDLYDIDIGDLSRSSRVIDLNDLNFKEDILRKSYNDYNDLVVRLQALQGASLWTTGLSSTMQIGNHGFNFLNSHGF
jgi:DNA-binding Xre family transcriptional regulator